MNRFATCTLIAALAWVSANADQPSAQQILKETGIQGGFIVHVGCGDGTLTAALHLNDSFIVQGLDTDAKHVEAARKHIASLGLYGKVTAEPWDGGRLPYIENFVNLVVVSEGCRVAEEEIMRLWRRTDYRRGRRRVRRLFRARARGARC